MSRSKFISISLLFFILINCAPRFVSAQQIQYYPAATSGGITGTLTSPDFVYASGTSSVSSASWMTADTTNSTTNMTADFEGTPFTFADFFNDVPVSGLQPSVPGSGLALTWSSGAAYIQGLRTLVPADSGPTYAAQNNTFVDVNGSGTYTYTPELGTIASPGFTWSDKAAGSSTATTIAITVTAPAAGTSVLVQCGNTSARTVSSITETNVTWNSSADVKETDGNEDAEAWSSKVVSASAGTTVTVTFSGDTSTGAECYAEGVNSQVEPVALDTVGSNDGAGTAVTSGSTGQNFQADELVISPIAISSNSTLTTSPLNHFTVNASTANASGSSAVLYSVVNSTAGSFNTGVTAGTTGTWAEVIATYKMTSPAIATSSLRLGVVNTNSANITGIIFPLPAWPRSATYISTSTTTYTGNIFLVPTGKTSLPFSDCAGGGGGGGGGGGNASAGGGNGGGGGGSGGCDEPTSRTVVAGEELTAEVGWGAQEASGHGSGGAVGETGATGSTGGNTIVEGNVSTIISDAGGIGGSGGGTLNGAAPGNGGTGGSGGSRGSGGSIGSSAEAGSGGPGGGNPFGAGDGGSQGGAAGSATGYGAGGGGGGGGGTNGAGENGGNGAGGFVQVGPY